MSSSLTLPNLTSEQQKIEHFLLALTASYSLYKLVSSFSLTTIIDGTLNAIPGAESVLQGALESQVDEAVRLLFADAPRPERGGIPAAGVSRADLEKRLRQLKDGDIDPGVGLTFAYVYSSRHADIAAITKAAFDTFAPLNALNPSAFPSLRCMEVEVVEMTKSMLGDVPGVCGTMTSGGTESIIMALKVARSFGRDVLGVGKVGSSRVAEVVLPTTAHPAFAKGGEYLGLRLRWIPVDATTQTADVAAMAAAVGPNTVLIVGSAPQYPHGVMDPIADLAALAKDRGILMHVDSCIGGFVLPWLPEAGYEVPPWDFRVPGVTSISLDAHKYGYTAKGASTIMYASADLRARQFTAYSAWPGGLFVSPSALGTRAGGPIAACWATMRAFGRKGYVESVRGCMDTTVYLRKAVEATDGVVILGDPVMTILSIAAENPAELNIYSVADVMEEDGGWHLERNQLPASMHLSVMPPHASTKEKFVKDLRAAIAKVRADPARYAKEGSAAMYGSVAAIPSGTIVDKFLVGWMSKVYSAPTD